MPPRIRTRASKALKENIDVSGNKVKPVKNNTKAPRKALADKTNSASDDASLEIPSKSKKTTTKSSKAGPKQTDVNKPNVETKHALNSKKQQREAKPKQNSQLKENPEPVNDVRLRRDRRLPTRFVENPILMNLSNNKDDLNVTHNNSTNNPKADNTPTKDETPSKIDKPVPSPFKTPGKADSSLLASRPRRICRLPSRFEDHSISPNKYIPLQPANASTPIQQSKTKPVVPQTEKGNTKNKVDKNVEKKQALVERPTRLAKIVALQKELSDNSSDKSSPDSNNNAKGRSTRNKKVKAQPTVIKKLSPINKKQSRTSKKQSPIWSFFTPMDKIKSTVKTIKSPINLKQTSVKKVSPKQSTNNKNLSFKLLGSKKKSQGSDNSDLDVYEFTFDPDEEPKPQKKKRKKTVTKKPAAARPKNVVYKSSYDQNISKALAALKNAVKSGKTTENPKLTQIKESNNEVTENVEQHSVPHIVNEVHNNHMALNDTGKTSLHECNYPSIRVEDIAADIEPSMDHHDDINYSPVNSPRPTGNMTPKASVNPRDSPERHVYNNDPLNLQEEVSFFDDPPVASSSMNISVRHPLASPWRVEFGSLPIKWPVNTYIKPNMTPAVESSFISSEDTIKKKHVYTNMLPQANDMFTEVVGNTSNHKQTSIISFIREMAEKSVKKKKEGRSVSPTKAIYEDIIDINEQTNKNKKSTKEAADNEAATPTNDHSEEVLSSANDTSNDKENSKEERKTRKRKNNVNVCNLPAKSPRKNKDKDCTYFGFDESENLDTENVSPIKVHSNPKGRSLRPQSRAVLREVNRPKAALPARTKIAISSDAVNKVYEELKSAADAPSFPEKNVDEIATNIEDPLINDDSESVHLFEDIELVHHLKPSRKSYGKAKKVTFLQRSTSSSDTQDGIGIVPNQNDSSDYDDLGDLTFEIPNVKEKKTSKKKKPKKLRTKKEEQEANAWVANFNSMCEDVEEFPLLIE